MLQDTNVVDFITRGEDGSIGLVLADAFDWQDEQTHLILLQDKVNRYFDFIDSGEAHRHFDCKDADPPVPVIIRVVLQHPPTPEGVRFFEELGKVAAGAGIGLLVELLPDEAEP